ncbi:hypothetical protein JT359_00745 [Candidatus Poribacteria bacterium]|nr:hypothetical protein [Candidatus Poribacteria bacterium]
MSLLTELHQLFMAYLLEHNAPEKCIALWQDALTGGGEGKWTIDYSDKDNE